MVTIGSQLITLDPKDTKDFMPKFKFTCLDLYRQSTLSRQHPRHGAVEISNSIRHTSLAPKWYHRHLRQNLPVPFNPFRFHILRGVTRSRHKDLQCNHAAHNRHRTIRQSSCRKTYHTVRARETFDYTGQTALGHNAMTNYDLSEDICTYILDSGAPRSHRRDLSLIQKPRPVHRKTKTATCQIVHCTHHRQTGILKNKCHELRFPVVLSPNITSNLLSV